MNDDFTLSATSTPSPLRPGYAIYCNLSLAADQPIEGAKAGDCMPFEVRPFQGARGPALNVVEVSTLLGPQEGLNIQGMLFEPMNSEGLYAMDILMRFKNGTEKATLGLAYSDQTGLLVLLPSCSDLRERFSGVRMLVASKQIDGQCESRNPAGRRALLDVLSQQSSKELIPASWSSVYRVTQVSREVAYQRRDLLLAEASAARARAELTLDIRRTTMREYVGAYRSRAEIQSGDTVYYGAPLIGPMFAIRMGVSAEQCSPVKSNRTRCTWSQTADVNSVNPLFDLLKGVAPQLPRNEAMSHEFVFADGRWTSPSLRRLFESRDPPDSAPTASSSSNDFWDAQNITKRTACSAAAGSRSNMASWTQALYGC